MASKAHSGHVFETTQNAESEPFEVFVQTLLPPDETNTRVEDIGEILKAIFDVGTWIMQHADFIDDVQSFWAQKFHGVTNIKRWENATDEQVEVWKLDGDKNAKKNYYRIAPGDTLNADMWVPWADRSGTGWLRYTDHHTVIKVGSNPLAYLWQNGDLIRFNAEDAFVEGGFAVPGASGAGGNRTMIIAKDPQGRTGFALGTYKP